MTIQTINVGNIANDGTGDDLREAMIKVNQNFDELDLRAPESTEGLNIGGAGEGIFAGKLGTTLQFKKLIGGDNVDVTANADTITLTVDSSLNTLVVSSDNGSQVIENNSTPLLLYGGQNIGTSYSTDNNAFVFEIQGDDLVAQDPAPSLSANLDANNNDIINVNNIIGNLTGNVHGTDIRPIKEYIEGFDFGGAITEINNIFDYIVANTDVNVGTIIAPEAYTIDFGEI